MNTIIAKKQGGVNTGLRLIFCLPAICVWLAASYFALKWFGHMTRGTITYGSGAAAILVPVLSGLTFVGALGSLVVVAMTCFGKTKLRW